MYPERYGNYYANIRKKLNKRKIKEGRQIVKPSLKGNDFTSVNKYLKDRGYEHIKSLSSGDNDDFVIRKDGVEYSMKSILTSLNSSFVVDCFNLYYAASDDFEIDITKNKGRAKIINKLSDYNMKSVTSSNALFSFFMSENMICYMLDVIKSLISDGEYNRDSLKSLNSALNNFSPSGMESSQAEALDKLLDKMSSEDIERMQNEALQYAKEENGEFKSFMMNSNESSEQYSLEDSINNIKNYMSVRDILKNLKISKSDNFIKSVLNSSLGGVKADFKTRTLDLSEAERVYLSKMHNIQFFNKKMKNALVDEVYIKEQRKSGKLDLFLDVSGSMGRNEDPRSHIIKVKSLAYYMIKKNMINKVYFFDTSLYGPYSANDISSILSFERGGGTRFDVIVSEVEKSGRKALVITDGESSGDILYNPNIYWCGIGSHAKFRRFRNPSNQSIKYIIKGQCGMYDDVDGVKMLSIND